MTKKKESAVVNTGKEPWAHAQNREPEDDADAAGARKHAPDDVEGRVAAGVRHPVPARRVTVHGRDSVREKKSGEECQGAGRGPGCCRGNSPSNQRDEGRA